MREIPETHPTLVPPLPLAEAWTPWALHILEEPEDTTTVEEKNEDTTTVEEKILLESFKKRR